MERTGTGSVMKAMMLIEAPQDAPNLIREDPHDENILFVGTDPDAGTGQRKENRNRRSSGSWD